MNNTTLRKEIIRLMLQEEFDALELGGQLPSYTQDQINAECDALMAAGVLKAKNGHYTLIALDDVTSAQAAILDEAIESKPLTVADMGEQFTLVTDSQEIKHILDNLGTIESIPDYGCLFVEVINGDYGRIYGCGSTVPVLTKRAYLLNPSLTPSL